MNIRLSILDMWVKWRMLCIIQVSGVNGFLVWFRKSAYLLNNTNSPERVLKYCFLLTHLFYYAVRLLHTGGWCILWVPQILENLHLKYKIFWSCCGFMLYKYIYNLFIYITSLRYINYVWWQVTDIRQWRTHDHWCVHVLEITMVGYI